MIWTTEPEPRVGDTRTRRRFLLLPERVFVRHVGRVWAWLEWVTVTETRVLEEVLDPTMAWTNLVPAWHTTAVALARTR